MDQNIEKPAEPKKFSLKNISFKNKYITKREIIIVVVVALIVFLILCDKPYFGDKFFLWKPSFWSASVLDGGYVFSIPQAGSSDGATVDKVVITDVSSSLGDEIQTAKDYIMMRFNEETSHAMIIVEDTTTEPVNIEEIGRLNLGWGNDAYYFIFTPGGEYSGNKVLEVAIKNGDTMLLASFRSRWMIFENNYAKAFGMIKSIIIK